MKRFAWINVNVRVPLEWDGPVDDWHKHFVALMKEKGLLEYTGSNLEEDPLEVCDQCDQEFSKGTLEEHHDEHLCRRCHRDALEEENSLETQKHIREDQAYKDHKEAI